MLSASLIHDIYKGHRYKRNLTDVLRFLLANRKLTTVNLFLGTISEHLIKYLLEHIL